MNSDYPEAKNSLYSPEHQRCIEIRYRQYNELRKDWEEIWNLIEAKHFMVKHNPTDIKGLLDLDNKITDLAFEYAHNRIYIDT